MAKTLERAGFRRVRQRGSHARFEGFGRRVTVPVGNKPLKRKTFAEIVKQTGISEEQFFGRR